MPSWRPARSPSSLPCPPQADALPGHSNELQPCVRASPTSPALIGSALPVRIVCRLPSPAWRSTGFVVGPQLWHTFIDCIDLSARFVVTCSCLLLSLSPYLSLSLCLAQIIQHVTRPTFSSTALRVESWLCGCFDDCGKVCHTGQARKGDWMLCGWLAKNWHWNALTPLDISLFLICVHSYNTNTAKIYLINVIRLLKKASKESNIAEDSNFEYPTFNWKYCQLAIVYNL